jgi:pimeloyl-ACP methyl ester carboxylesterase
MTNFLLLHGGSHGSWCWERLLFEIERLGHRGYAFDLPGHGQDATPRSEVTIDSYITAVGSFVASQQLREFTVVGHSLSGVIMPEIAQLYRERIREVVYVAGIVLNAGEAAIDFIPAERRTSYFKMADESADGSFMASLDAARRVFFNDLSEEEAASFYRRLTPQPLAPYLARAKVGPEAIGVPRRYILCRKDQALSPVLCHSFAQKLGVCEEEIDCGHDVMLSKPGELAKVLCTSGITLS